MKTSAGIGYASAPKYLLLVVLLVMGWAVDPGMCGDASMLRKESSRQDGPPGKTDSDFNLGAWFATSVWKHISAVDGQRCPSEPTCSSYSAQVFRKHGFFMGWLMTVDRLIHEADEGRHAPLVRVDGQLKIFDPVKNNDVWWYDEDRQTQE